MALAACPQSFSVSSLLHNYYSRFIRISVSLWEFFFPLKGKTLPFLSYQSHWEPVSVLISCYFSCLQNEFYKFCKEEEGKIHIYRIFF